MIIWLASYPRSGNTLLRTILYQSMGMGSYSEYSMGAVVRNTPLPPDLNGMYLHSPLDWGMFYRQASASPEVWLVKTHGRPIDRQKAIYVVRDARQAFLSYRQYHGTRHPAADITLDRLICGLDHYGDWTDHYRAWVDGSRDTLVLQYEHLVEADMATLKQIADFVGHDGEIRPWANSYRRLEPEAQGRQFRPRMQWTGEDTWTPAMDAIFWPLHGELMRELGYSGQADAASGPVAVPDTDRLCQAVIMMAGEIRGMRRQLADKQRQIELLAGVCEERAELIRQLDGRSKQ